MPELIRPPALKAGDTIAIAALSSPLETDLLEMYERGTMELEALGFTVRAAPLSLREVGLDVLGGHDGQALIGA